MLSSKAQWLVECSCIPPTTFVIVTNQKCQLYQFFFQKEDVFFGVVQKEPGEKLTFA